IRHSSRRMPASLAGSTDRNVPTGNEAGLRVALQVGADALDGALGHLIIGIQKNQPRRTCQLDTPVAHRRQSTVGSAFSAYAPGKPRLQLANDSRRFVGGAVIYDDQLTVLLQLRHYRFDSTWQSLRIIVSGNDNAQQHARGSRSTHCTPSFTTSTSSMIRYCTYDP